MPKIILLPVFHKRLRKFTNKNKERTDAVGKTLQRFQENANHPSLHLEKLKGGNTWTIRIDQGNRLFFVWSDTGDTAIFFFVGPHDSYKNIPK